MCEEELVKSGNNDNHKKRLRAKQKMRKVDELNNIIKKVNPKMFPSMEISEKEVESFWSKVSKDCDPYESRLSESIVNHHLLGVEQARQKKFLKKLEKQVEMGVISAAERDERLANYGRGNLKNQHDDDDDVTEFSLLNQDRGLRKRQQVNNISALIKLHDIEGKQVVVDFGSGSGNLCLALASVYPSTSFVFVDQNQTSLDILKKRSEEANLGNIIIKQFKFSSNNLAQFIEEIQVEVGEIGLGIGLHCCGSFTDMVMEMCRVAGSDCLVVPCCNGKIDATTDHYPRSSIISSVVSGEEYQLLSAAADDLSCREAKISVETDRAHWASEAGASQVQCWSMEPSSASPKNLMIYAKFTSSSDPT